MGSYFSYLGAATLIYLTYRLGNHAYTFLRPSTLPSYIHPTSPTYALITGASAGIGLAFADELCRQGINVILHGRNPDKLSRARQELLAAYPTRDVRLLICDVMTFTPESLEKLLVDAEIDKLHLAILINNVGGTGGVSLQPFQRLALITPAEVDGLITLNQRFTTHLTRLLLPKFTSSRSPSLIVNISSHSQKGLPYLAVYSGTKAYLAAFSRALSVELAADGHKQVSLLTVVVGSVQSQQNHSPISFFVPSSATMARAALRRVGCGKQSVSGYWPHALQSGPLRVLPDWVGDRMIVGMLKPLADGGVKEF